MLSGGLLCNVVGFVLRAGGDVVVGAVDANGAGKALGEGEAGVQRIWPAATLAKTWFASAFALLEMKLSRLTGEIVDVEHLRGPQLRRCWDGVRKAVVMKMRIQ